MTVIPAYDHADSFPKGQVLPGFRRRPKKPEQRASGEFVPCCMMSPEMTGRRIEKQKEISRRMEPVIRKSEWHRQTLGRRDIIRRRERFMKELWNFFEEMDEMVYVSDVENHQLVYINQHLREALGFRSCMDYQGKKCYEILQGRHAPCPFCTNSQLRQGKFIAWVHNNPVLSKRFLIKDSLLVSQGRKYRIEIAIDSDSKTSGYMPYFHARNETILNECLQQIFSTPSPETAMEQLLAYIGKTFGCDRAYIFEIDGRHTSNTYEWCAENVLPQKELLQKVSLNGIGWWLDLFADNQVTVIEDLENIRRQYPEAYAVLKPQNITSLVAGPIKSDGQNEEIIGFLGVDNPDKQKMSLVAPFLNVIGYFTLTLLRRRDLLARLSELSYHDQLTGALNRNALAEYYERMPMKTVGVVYCDITGLKNVNDSLGHAAGDRIICQCYELINRSLQSGKIYRTGGDEFIALCPDCTDTEFQSMVRRLQEAIRRNENHMALGYVWSDDAVLNLEELIIQADQVMYEDKRIYYKKYSRKLGVERRRSGPDNREGRLNATSGSFQEFLSTAYCDVEALFKSVAEDNASSYFYFGDMQKNLFYISDNMRDDFGFQDNIVPDLLSLWGKRISTPEFRETYWQDISDMVKKKRAIHDLRYRVKDVKGNNKWIRCYGHMIWNEDRSLPIFFSGRISCQDRQFVVDPITTLPRENASFRELNRLRMDGIRTLIIGFGLNGITELNSTKGRPYGDRLLRKVSETLMENLSAKASFFRLEGARYLAVVTPDYAQEGCEAWISRIQEIVKNCYTEMEIQVSKVCSFGVMEYPCEDFMPEDVVENMVSLIRLAKQEPGQEYFDYSADNVRRIKECSNLTLKLGEDVLQNMNNFRIMVQPMVSSETKSVIGGEVLLRWKYQGEDISPAKFIPHLEKDHTIHQVGRWVFEQAVCTCGRIRAYDPDFFLTFNVSLFQLSDEGFLDFMEDTLKKYHVDGSGLIAELTESSLDESTEKLIRFVHECQRMGIRIALDNFGSGCSSLRMILQCPSAIIKLDRSLIREVMGSREKMSFMKSIIFACHQFGKTVCVEGVEQDAQDEIVVRLGCDMLQGFYYYQPMEVSDIYLLIGNMA